MVHPHVDPPQPADAIVVLGGAPIPRVAEGEALARAGYAPVLAISAPGGRNDTVTSRACARPAAAYDVVCFRPHPAKTRGEFLEVARLSRRYGWRRVIVVTSTYHVARSRMLANRCLDGTVLMVPSEEHVPLHRNLYELVYQSVGWLKAQVLRGC